MATTIGPVVAKVTANAEGLYKEVDKAGAKFRSTSDKIADDAFRFGVKFQKEMEKAGDKAGKSLVERFAGAAKFGGIIAGGGLAAGLVGTVAAYMDGASAIREMGEAAIKTATPLSNVQGIVAAFGKTEDAVDALAKFNTALSRAAVLGEGLANFDAIGLNAKELAGRADAFEQLADKIGSMRSGWQQSWAAMSIFGEDYKKLMPVLSRGGEYIREQSALLKAFGADVTGGMVASVRKADEIWKQIGMLKQAFSVQVAGGVAPMLAALKDRMGNLPDWGLSFKGLSSRLIDAAEGVSKLGLALKSMFSNAEVREGLYLTAEALFRSLGHKIGEWLAHGVGTALKAVGTINLGKWFGFERTIDVGSIGEKLLAVGKDGARSSRVWWETMKLNWGGVVNAMANEPGLAGVTKFFADVRAYSSSTFSAVKQNNFFDVLAASAQQLIASTRSPFDQIKQELRGLVALVEQSEKTVQQMNAPAKLGGPLANWSPKNLGLDVLQITDALNLLPNAIKRGFFHWDMTAPLVENIKRIEVGAIQHAFGDLFKNMESPLAKLDLMGPPKALFQEAEKREAIKMNAIITDAAALKANERFRQLLAQFPAQEYRAVGAMAKGTREAYSTILANENTPRESIQEALRRIAEEALKVEKDNLATGKDILNELKDNPVLRMGGIW